MGLYSIITEKARYELNDAKSHLTKAMVHIIKWYCQPDHQTTSWAHSILDYIAYVERFINHSTKTQRDMFNVSYVLIVKKACSEAKKEISSFYTSKSNIPMVPNSINNIDYRLTFDNVINVDFCYNFMSEFIYSEIPGVNKVIDNNITREQLDKIYKEAKKIVSK